MLSGSTDKRPSSAPVRTDVRVGEADAGLEIDLTQLPAISISDPAQPLSQKLESEHQTYLSSLPPTAILQARTAAYRRVNANLEIQAKALHSQSSELEAQLRKVIALCTGTEESRVEEMAVGLIAAVESEGSDDVEVGRVREFLRRVENEREVVAY